MGHRIERGWDAASYDEVSAPQLEWGEEVLARLRLSGEETVIDAGCGSGRVSELLLERLPRGRLIAVDSSPAMLERARQRLGERAELVDSDLLELELSGVADAVFSSATFHWIDDHDRLFARIGSWLRPGGRLEAQCGGAGNVRAFLESAAAVAGRDPFAEHLASVEVVPHFATAERTAERLAERGFEAISCSLEPRRTRLAEPRAYVETVCLGTHLDALPESLRSPYLDAVLGEWGEPVLDYVRLNISARRADPAR